EIFMEKCTDLGFDETSCGIYGGAALSDLVSSWVYATGQFAGELPKRIVCYNACQGSADTKLTVAPTQWFNLPAGIINLSIVYTNTQVTAAGGNVYMSYYQPSMPKASEGLCLGD